MVGSTDDPWQTHLSSLPPPLAALHRNPPHDVLPMPDGRAVEVPELLSVLREQTAPLAGVGVRAVRPERHGAGLVAAAWRHVVYRQVRAVLTLIDAELAAEAQPNARTAIEHAVVLQRLAGAADLEQHEPLLEALLRAQQRRQGKTLDYLDELDLAADGQHQNLLAAARRMHTERQLPPDKTRPDVRTIESLFLGVPSGRHFYRVYARLSENSHAGVTSAAPYLVRAVQTGPPVVEDAEPVPWAETLAVLSWACWAADDAMRRFLINGRDIAARHVPIMAKVGLAPGTSASE